MEEKKKSGKRKYNDGYTRNNTGEFVYTGEYYRFDMPQQKINGLKLIYSVLALATAVAFLVSGFLNNEGSRVMYVILPYAALFLPVE